MDELIPPDLWTLWRAKEAVSDLHATMFVLPKDSAATMEILTRMWDQIDDCRNHLLQISGHDRRYRKE